MQDNVEPQKHKFRLSGKELDCIQQLGSKDARIAVLIAKREPKSARVLPLELESTDAQKLREYLTEHLARMGFDEKYEINEQGRVLEELIDRLFIP